MQSMACLKTERWVCNSINSMNELIQIKTWPCLEDNVELKKHAILRLNVNSFIH